MRSEKCRRVEENKKNASEYLEKLEKKVKEDQTGPLGGTDLNSYGSSSPREHSNPKSSYNINQDTQVGPKLATIQERQGSIRSSLKFHKVNEESIDEDLDVEKIRKKLMRKYASVFKKDLGREDRVRMDPVKVELIDETKVMGNCMIPTEAKSRLSGASPPPYLNMFKGILRHEKQEGWHH